MQMKQKGIRLTEIHNNGNSEYRQRFLSKMLSLFGITVVVYFMKMLSGSRKDWLKPELTVKQPEL
jgi:hypothetical protein